MPVSANDDMEDGGDDMEGEKDDADDEACEADDEGQSADDSSSCSEEETEATWDKTAIRVVCFKVGVDAEHVERAAQNAKAGYLQWLRSFGECVQCSGFSWVESSEDSCTVLLSSVEQSRQVHVHTGINHRMHLCKGA